MLTAKGKDGRRIPVINNDGSKNTTAYCPCCGKSMVAKAGEMRIPHWAHSKAERCDEWWEPETEWHVEWRNRFLDVSEAVSRVEVEHVLEKDGTKHFSDVRINDELSLVLRRARLDENTINARISFFGNLIWIVQGKVSEYNRLKRQLSSKELKKVDGLKNCYKCDNIWYSFFERWSCSRCPIVFDFKSASDGSEADLWIVVPQIGNKRNIVCMSIDEFRDRLIKDGRLFKKSYEEVNAEFDKRKTIVEEQGRRGCTSSVKLQSDALLSKISTSECYADILKMYGGNEELAKYWSQKGQMNGFG